MAHGLVRPEPLVAQRPSRADLAEAAHDLRAPLGGVNAMAMLLAQTRLTDEQRKLVDALIASARHLNEVATAILNDYRDDAAASAGLAASGGNAFELMDFLAAIEAPARARAASQALQFRCQVVPPGTLRLAADQTLLRRMVENLIDNAFKWTRQGGVTLAVERIGVRGRKLGLCFRVEDTGPGFTAGQAGLLFSPFGRLDERQPGTGLGLSMVRSAAELLGGEAGAKGMPGKGAHVWFTAWLQTAEPSQTVIAPPAVIGPPPPEAGKLDVLIVDDSRSSRMVLRAMLEHLGCKVSEADCGEAALTEIMRGQFDAVLTDLNMAGMSGVEMARAIRDLPGAAVKPHVIAVTGQTSAATELEFIQAGAKSFVAKPLTARALALALAAVESARRA